MKLEMSVIRRKIMGVALRQARLAQGRSLEDCAGMIHASAEEIAQIERGVRDLTLPELETLAAYLQVPVSAIVSGQLPAGDTAARALSPQVLALRRKIVGALLRKAREAAGKDVAEVAAALDVAPETVQQYERGQLDIPAAQLVAASDMLQIPLESFLQSPPASALPPMGADLPEETRAFVASPQSRPYLQLAMALSRFSPEVLRALGEALLALPAAES